MCLRSLVLIVCTWFCLVEKGLGFNIDGDATRIKFAIDPLSETPDSSSEFGWSIAFFKTLAEARLIVGAPKFDNRSGAVYNCIVNGNDHTCFSMVNENQDSARVGDIATHGELLGVSVSSTDSSITACASFSTFNFTMTKESDIPRRNYFVGRCPVWNEDLNYEYSETPCYKASTTASHPKDFGMCSLGMGGVQSFKSDSDNKEYRFLTAPGSGKYKGAVVATADGEKISRFINKRNGVTNDKTFDVIERGATSQGSLLGYASTKGNFTGQSLPGFAAGAPKAEMFKGEVLIYSYSINTASTPPSPDDSALTFVTSIINPTQSKGGPNFFGAALAAIDIDGDGFDDLVVGAPLFTNIDGNKIGQDEGRAFIFMNNGQGSTFVYDVTVKLIGKNERGSRFGSTIVNIGDINNDNFDDLAIGAPWGGADGNGVVFIYNVRNKKMVNVPSQILNSPLKSGMFGYSITAAKVDTRVYPDLAVGAPKSGRVFLFKAKTIITLNHTLHVDKTSISTDDQNCEHKGVGYQCIKFTSNLEDVSTNAPAVFDVEITLKSDVESLNFATRRAFVYDNITDTLVDVFSRNVTFTRGGKVPFEQTVFLSIDKNTNFGLPVKISTLYSTVDTPTNCQDGPCAILDQFGALNGFVEVNYLRQCGADDTCQIDLEIKSAEIKVIKGNTKEDNLLLVGSFNNEIKLTAKVTNNNESAYLAKMEVNYDTDFTVLQVTVNRRSVIVDSNGPDVNGTGNIVKFLLDNPILVDETVDVEVRFLLKNLNRPKQLEYPFHLAVNSTGLDSNHTNNRLSVPISMGIQSCITISLNQQGEKSSEAPKVLYDHLKATLPDPTTREDIGPNIEYTFLVQNSGSVPIENMSIDITLVEKVGQQETVFVLDLLVDGRECDPRVNIDRLTGDNINGTADVNNTNDDVVTPVDTKPPVLDCLNGACETYTCSGITNLPVDGVVRIRMSLAVYLSALQKFQSKEMIVKVGTKFHGEFGPRVVQKIGCQGIMELSQPFERIQQKGEDKKKVEWWIILVAIVGALILLAIFCAILYRIGFFKRQRMEDTQPLHGGHHMERYQQKRGGGSSNGYDSE